MVFFAGKQLLWFTPHLSLLIKLYGARSVVSCCGVEESRAREADCSSALHLYSRMSSALCCSHSCGDSQLSGLRLSLGMRLSLEWVGTCLGPQATKVISVSKGFQSTTQVSANLDIDNIALANLPLVNLHQPTRSAKREKLQYTPCTAWQDWPVPVLKELKQSSIAFFSFIIVFYVFLFFICRNWV